MIRSFHGIPTPAPGKTLQLLPFLLLGSLLSPQHPAFPQTAGAPPPSDQPTLIVTVGAPGETEFGDLFNQWAQSWTEAASQTPTRTVSIGLDAFPDTSDHERLRQTLAQEPKTGDHPLWIVLIGHGTFNNQVPKFNLRGPDLAAQDLAAWLEPFQRPVAILNTASASGAFLKTLSASNRVVLTATRSGKEQNFARLGAYLADAMSNEQADLDKDNQTSLLEAYLFASSQVADFYDNDGRLATEHALLDDNGDGLGTPPDWFKGVRVVKKAREGRSHDGLRAHQLHLVPSKLEQKIPLNLRAERDDLERQILRLRDRKSEMNEDNYYAQLEDLLVQMADIYARFEAH